MKDDGGAKDFDFLFGAWRVHNRRLRDRLKGSTSWVEFDATVVARPLLGGVGNEDVYRTDFAGGFTGMSLRFFDRAQRRWSIYWADSRKGTLDPPVVGGFDRDVGVFEGADTFEGRAIRVRFTWSCVESPTPRWEQAFSADGGKNWETNWIMDFERDGILTAGEFPVVELARYRIEPGERERFARCFDGYFPEALQQLGAVFLGQFLERGSDTFTYLRGFPSMDARAEVKGEFYNGVLWKEHAGKMNSRLIRYDDVLLLRPLGPGRGLRAKPAVDLSADGDGGPGGAVVFQVFAVEKGAEEDLARRAEEAFVGYRAAGAREEAVLVTLDAPNNFPRHPVRSDGPHLVWVGAVEDEAALERLTALARRAGHVLSPHLRTDPELVLLDPTPRSRLRAGGVAPNAATDL